MRIETGRAAAIILATASLFGGTAAEAQAPAPETPQQKYERVLQCMRDYATLLDDDLYPDKPGHQDGIIVGAHTPNHVSFYVDPLDMRDPNKNPDANNCSDITDIRRTTTNKFEQAGRVIAYASNDTTGNTPVGETLKTRRKINVGRRIVDFMRTTVVAPQETSKHVHDTKRLVLDFKK